MLSSLSLKMSLPEYRASTALPLVNHTIQLPGLATKTQLSCKHTPTKFENSPFDFVLEV